MLTPCGPSSNSMHPTTVQFNKPGLTQSHRIHAVLHMSERCVPYCAQADIYTTHKNKDTAPDGTKGMNFTSIYQCRVEALRPHEDACCWRQDHPVCQSVVYAWHTCIMNHSMSKCSTETLLVSGEPEVKPLGIATGLKVVMNGPAHGGVIQGLAWHQ